MAGEWQPSQGTTVEEMAARELADDLKAVPKMVAQIKGISYGQQELTRDNELWLWGFRDESVDVPTLRAQGHSEADIALLAFPGRRKLIEQAGTTYAEQEVYANKTAASWLAAQAKGRLPKPPARPPQTLKG